MAKVFPKELPYGVRRNPRSRAELRVYDALKSQLGKDWTVFYHVAWLGLTHPNDAPRDGETDFIIAHPEHGILLLEVKGGRIRYEGEIGQWWSIDGQGVEHPIAPFDQVRRCKYALLNKVLSLPSWSKCWIRLGHAVAFPDVAVPRNALPPEAPPEIIIDSDDLPRLEKRILEIWSYWRGREPGVQEHGAALVVDLERLLAPTALLRNPLSAEVEEEERELLRLTEEQFHLLDFLGRRRRAAVQGCAGSGKTMLAVEKAKRLAREGFRTLILCYHEPLAAHLARASQGIENLEALSFRQLCQLATQHADIPLPTASGIGGRGHAEDALAEALMQAVQVRPELTYDAIIVDEGQDFQETWWVAVQDCLREGGDGILYIFFDDNQRVYTDRAHLPIDAADHFPLTENVRNTRAIHQALTAYYRGEYPSRSRGPAGRSVEKIPYETESDLTNRLASVLHRLVVAEAVRPADIAVLTPRQFDTSVLPRLWFENGFRLVEQPSKHHREVLCVSIPVFKGLERAVVIVAELEEEVMRDDLLVSLCYVAFSRPRSHLVLMGQDAVLTRLMSASPAEGR